MNIISNPSRKIKVLITMLLIVIASILFAIQSQPVKHYAPGLPGYEVMRRESDPTRSILVNLPNGQTLVWEVA